MKEFECHFTFTLSDFFTQIVAIHEIDLMNDWRAHVIYLNTYSIYFNHRLTYLQERAFWFIYEDSHGV
jgi:ABC-type phosphate/phosphonate transport system ATPase subunit